MSYSYLTDRGAVVRRRGMEDVLRMLTFVNSVLEKGGAITMGAAMRGGFKHKGAYENWYAMAVVDTLEEHGFIREVSRGGVQGQDRVFIKGTENI